MTEAQLQSLLTKYIREEIKKGKVSSHVYELKIKKNNEPLNFKSDLRPQQIPSLLGVKKSCLSYKLGDLSLDSKPFDGVVLCNLPAYLVVCWYEPRKLKILYYIDPIIIDKMIRSGKKSLRKADVGGLCDFKLTL